MNKEQENQFKENIKEIARLELKNSFNNNLMETLNSAFIFKYVDTLEKQNKKYKEVIEKIKTRYCDYYGTTKEINDDYVLRNVLKEILDILKEVE